MICDMTFREPQLFPTAAQAKNRLEGPVSCKERLGGLLKYYHRKAA